MRRFRQLWSRTVALTPTPIDTPHLLLTPVTRELAEAVAQGDTSAVNAAEGWPHEDTLDGLKMALDHGHAPGWFATLDGVVIGDCGVHAEPDEEGVVEIGFGLAAPFRQRGYGSELVAGLSRWLLEQPGISRVSARTLIDNRPSRRVLERAGFVLESTEEHYVSYTLDRAAG